MRIIGGAARGRRLFAPDGDETRPTTDRIRESLFNILGQRMDGERVLDLFGGTGALALEAVSRGAAYAQISDSGRKQVECIRRNAENVAGRWPGRVRVLRADYREAIQAAEGRYSLVFLDPPYRMAGAYADAARLLLRAERLSEGARLVMEHLPGLHLALPEAFAVEDLRHYGNTEVSLVRLVGAASVEE